jgi:Ca2+-binding EF-hand superfamily protein
MVDTESEIKRRSFRFWGGKRKERKDGKESSSSVKAAPPPSNASRTSATSKTKSSPTKVATTASSKSILKKGPAGEAVSVSKPGSISTSTQTLDKSENNSTSNVHNKPELPVSWLSRSKRFRKWCEWAFQVIDTDKSNSVDEKELYSGLLLIHLKLGTYAGPAACRPLGRERCHAVFQKMDLDGSGHLDYDEFQQVMSVLFGNIVLRVLAQWSLTIMVR